MAMNIRINGQALALPENSGLSTLIERLQVSGGRYAVELNGRIVPRSQHTRTVLAEGDVVEVVQAIGGG